MEDGDETGRRRECFNAKTRDMSETDVGLYSANGPKIALLAYLSVRRENERDLLDDRQTLEEVKGGLHSTGLPSYVDASSQQALIITKQKQTD